MSESTFRAQVWDRLSSININDHVQDKNGLKFLSWAWAWGALMDEYPDSTYSFGEIVSYEDGTCEVWVTVTVSNGVETARHQMWLPVMDYKNHSISNPDSRKISDSRMRCLTKCLAMFGLGHYIYAGEDIPREDKEAVLQRNKAADVIIKAIADNEPSIVAEAWRELTEDEQAKLWVAKTKGGYFTQEEKKSIRAALEPVGEV